MYLRQTHGEVQVGAFLTLKLLARNDSLLVQKSDMHICKHYFFSPHHCVGFLLLVVHFRPPPLLPPPAALPPITHIKLTHTQLTHIQLTHMQLTHTQLTHTQLTHTQLTHTPTHTHTTCPQTTYVAGVALGDIDLHFAWQAWHLWHWAGSGGALASRLAPWSPRPLAWQAWHLATSIIILCGRCGTW